MPDSVYSAGPVESLPLNTLGILWESCCNRYLLNQRWRCFAPFTKIGGLRE